MIISVQATRVGVLIPTFNRVGYLRLAVTSVLKQSHRNFELVVIDNGSTDGTSEFISELYDQRMRYIVNEDNLGLIGSINKGMLLFSDEVEWCTILSDDDLLDNNFIQRLLESAVGNVDCDIIHSHRIFIDAEGQKIREANFPPPEETALNYLTMRSLSRRETFLTGVMFRRTAFKELGGYPTFSTGLASDDAFIFALGLKNNILFNRETAAFIRIHAEAESRSFTGITQKIKTLKEFSAYCRDAVRECKSLSPATSGSLNRIIGKYVVIMCSGYWLRSLHYTLEGHGDDVLHEQAALRSLVSSEQDLFSWRVRLNTLLGSVSGFPPEAFGLYRFLVGIIEGCIYRFKLSAIMVRRFKNMI